LIREHKAEAEIVAARRADEMLERGERDEQLVWLRNRRVASRAPGEAKLAVSPSACTTSNIGDID
jgi:hypothetical protein